MNKETLVAPNTDRLLVEIVDVDRDIDDEVTGWVQTELTRRSGQLELGAVEVWLAVSDDSGPLGDGRNRVVLIHHPAAPVGEVPLEDGDKPDWITQRHTYDGAPVSDRRVPGRPDPALAGGMRLVAMNCADGAEDEFNAWYEEDHLPKFTAVTGVLDGRRLHSPDSPRQHVAIYWLEDIQQVGTPEWKAAAGTDWTAAMRKKTFDRDRINLVPFTTAVAN